jgi:hypothetical protein
VQVLSVNGPTESDQAKTQFRCRLYGDVLPVRFVVTGSKADLSVYPKPELVPLWGSLGQATNCQLKFPIGPQHVSVKRVTSTDVPSIHRLFKLQ